jgi:hypothetical protein
MLLRCRKNARLLAIAFAVACVCPAARAATKLADATGTWKWTVEFNGNSFEQSLKLKQEGTKLTGVHIGRNDMETPIEDGKVENDEISFTLTRTFNDNKFVQKYKGKIDGDTIKGKVEFERNGEKMTRDWEPKRAK